MTSEIVVSGREEVADWLETTLLLRETAPLGVDAVLSLASSESGAGPAQVELGLGVMRRRAEVLESRYPFQVHDYAVRARPEALSSAYSALLLLTPRGAARQLLFPRPTSQMVLIFERLTEQAVAALWGPAGRALRFGWPSDVGRPQDFYSAIPWLAAQIGLPVGAGYRPPRRKDGGVDVVGWRPFPDGRSGFPVILVQCTLQTDIGPKARDIDVRLWASWLAMDEAPQTALAVPQTIPTGTEWDDLVLHGAVFERLRLAGLLPQEAVVEGLQEWVRETAAALKPLLAGGEWS